jgi:hypothetical protein
VENTLFGVGAGCIIAAIIGGGLKAFGMEIPLFNSIKRQVLLGLFGLILITSPFVLRPIEQLLPLDAEQIPQVAGLWRITQHGEQNFDGSLDLKQDGTAFSGKLVWDTIQPAKVVSGKISGNRMRFLARYDSGDEGTYDGKLNSSFDFVEGQATGPAAGKDINVTWSARR